MKHLLGYTIQVTWYELIYPLTGTHLFTVTDREIQSLCSMWTALHVPVVNVPGLEGDHALPIGVTLVGGRYKDRAVLRMARLVGDAFAAVQ